MRAAPLVVPLSAAGVFALAQGAAREPKPRHAPNGGGERSPSLRPRKDGDGSLQGMIAATRAYGFGSEVKRRILLGTYVLSSGYYDAWYKRALKVRRLIRGDFERAFESVDVIACPTSPTAAFRLGEKVDDPVAMYLSDVMTVPTSLAGMPAVSVPTSPAMPAVSAPSTGNGARAPAAPAAGATPTVCPSCGSKLLEGAVACMDCGYLVQAEAAGGEEGPPNLCTNPACGVANPPGERTCQRCNSPLPATGTMSTVGRFGPATATDATARTSAATLLRSLRSK